jgi:CDP-glucose 4,6-dehydratase
VVTTDKVYENKETDYAYSETDKLGGFDPYSASKAAAEIVVSTYRDSFFNTAEYDNHKMAIATARAGNVIGGGDWATDRIIPDIVRAFRSEQPIVIRNPQSIRPWQHVTEPLSGYLLLGASMMQDPVKYSSAWNFGPGDNVVLTVKEIVQESIKAWGSGNYTINQPDEQPHEAGLLMLNINKAKNELQWLPKLAAAEAIEWTIQWYRNATPESAFEFTLEQIDQYQEL